MAANKDTAAPVELSERDLIVLRGVADGLPYRRIGEQLDVTGAYVYKLSTLLRAKLRAKTNAHAVAIAYDLGILTPRGAS